MVAELRPANDRNGRVNGNGRNDPSSGYEVRAQIEREFFSALLAVPEETGTYFGILLDSDFADLRHRILYRAIKKADQVGAPITLTTLADDLKTSNQLERIGGPVYLAEIVDAGGMPHHLEELARRIRISALCEERSRLFAQAAADDSIDTSRLDQLESSIKRIEAPGSLFAEQSLDTIDSSIASWFSADGALIHPPPRRWVVEDMYERQTAALLVGKGGIGKGLLAIAVSAYITTGRALPGRELHDAETCLFVSREDDKAEVHRRLYNQLQRLDWMPGGTAELTPYEWEELQTRFRVVTLAAGEQIDDLAYLERLERHLENLRPPIGLIVCDGLLTMSDIGGSGDTAWHVGATTVMSRLADLAYKFDCHVLGIHHKSKGDTAFGSVQLENIPRMVSNIEALPENHTYELPDEWEGEWGVLKVTKSNHTRLGVLFLLHKDPTTGALGLMRPKRTNGAEGEGLDPQKVAFPDSPFETNPNTLQPWIGPGERVSPSQFAQLIYTTSSRPNHRQQSAALRQLGIYEGRGFGHIELGPGGRGKVFVAATGPAARGEL